MIDYSSKTSFQFFPVRPNWRRLAALFCLIALLSSAGRTGAQQNNKRPIAHTDYDSWRTIQGQQISRDGKFVAYGFLPEDGDGEIIVRNVSSGAEWRSARGYRPPATPPEEGSLAEFQAAQSRLI